MGSENGSENTINDLTNKDAEAVVSQRKRKPPRWMEDYVGTVCSEDAARRQDSRMLAFREVSATAGMKGLKATGEQRVLESNVSSKVKTRRI